MLGGKRQDQSKCSHDKTMSVTSTNIERIVCEDCGFVSFSFQDESKADIDRNQFARTVDQLEPAVITGTFQSER